MTKGRIWLIIILSIVIIGALSALGISIWNAKCVSQILSEYTLNCPEHAAGWTEYINEELGFSIWVPEKMSNGDTLVPVKILEDNKNNTVYIVSEEKTIESLTPNPEYPFIKWAFTVKSVENDKALEAFIKYKFGSDCKLSKKEYMYGSEYHKSEVYDVKAESPGMESNCPLNFQYKILYAPGIQKAMSVVIGQECGFSVTSGQEYGAICYDQLIIDSFKFKFK